MHSTISYIRYSLVCREGPKEKVTEGINKRGKNITEQRWIKSKKKKKIELINEIKKKAGWKSDRVRLTCTRGDRLMVSGVVLLGDPRKQGSTRGSWWATVTWRGARASK